MRAGAEVAGFQAAPVVMPREGDTAMAVAPMAAGTFTLALDITQAVADKRTPVGMRVTRLAVGVPNTLQQEFHALLIRLTRMRQRTHRIRFGAGQGRAVE